MTTSATDGPDSASTRVTSKAPIIQVLTDDIIQERIAPGTHLDEAGLCKRFGLSRTPVREALHELCARNLAEHIPFRGVIVREISAQDIEHLFEAMSEIEGLCGRLAAVRMGISDRAELFGLHDSMVEMMRRGDTDGYTALNTRFHDLIAIGAGNRDILAMSNALRARVAPYRGYQLRESGRMERSCAEHLRICEAILAQNGAEAELALKRHLISAAHEVILRRGHLRTTKAADHAD